MPPNPMLTKQALAADYLRSAIVSGELAPGSRVVIDRVAQALEISAIPVREALQQLEAEGLVSIRPHAGAVVTQVSRDDVLEVFTLLASLEAASTPIACERATAETIQELRHQVAAMDIIAEKSDHRAWVEANGIFHQTIAGLCNMPLLDDFMQRVLSRWERVRFALYPDGSGDNWMAWNVEHAAMVDAIEANQPTQLADLLKIHNEQALRHYLERDDLND